MLPFDKQLAQLISNLIPYQISIIPSTKAILGKDADIGRDSKGQDSQDGKAMISEVGRSFSVPGRLGDAALTRSFPQ